MKDLVLRGTEDAIDGPRGKKVLSVANFADVPISTATVSWEELHALAATCSMGGPPPKDLVLVVGKVCHVTMSNSMLRIVGSMVPAFELLGRNGAEAAQVDAWLSFVWHSVELPLQVLREQASSANESPSMECSDQIQRQLDDALLTVDNHLVRNSYLVGDSVTIADLSLAVALTYSSECVIPRKASSLSRWLTKVSAECNLNRVK